MFKKIKNLFSSIQKLTTPPPEKKCKKGLPKNEVPKQHITISTSDITKAVVVTLLLLALGLLVHQIKDILILFFVSVLFAAALDPTINKLEQYKIPRSLSVITILLGVLIFISLAVINFVPVLANQLWDLGFKAQELIGNVTQGNIPTPAYLEWINPLLSEVLGTQSTETFTQGLQNYLLQFSNELRSVADSAYKLFLYLSNGMANAVLVLLLTYFMVVDEKEIDQFILKLFPKRCEEYITDKSNTIKTKVGFWLRGQLILMFVIGFVTYIGLVIIGVDYAFTLALFAGLTELIPVVGPILGWVMAIPIAINQSVNIFIWMSILYFTVQRLENTLIVPLVMKQATGLHPIIVIISMLIGFEFMGILGVIISVPVASVIGIFLEDYLEADK